MSRYIPMVFHAAHVRLCPNHTVSVLHVWYDDLCVVMSCRAYRALAGQMALLADLDWSLWSGHQDEPKKIM